MVKGPGEGATSTVVGLTGEPRFQALNAFTSSMNVVSRCATGGPALAAAAAFRSRSDRAGTPVPEAAPE